MDGRARSGRSCTIYWEWMPLPLTRPSTTSRRMAIPASAPSTPPRWTPGSAPPPARIRSRPPLNRSTWPGSVSGRCRTRGWDGSTATGAAGLRRRAEAGRCTAPTRNTWRGWGPWRRRGSGWTMTMRSRGSWRRIWRGRRDEGRRLRHPRPVARMVTKRARRARVRATSPRTTPRCPRLTRRRSPPILPTRLHLPSVSPPPRPARMLRSAAPPLPPRRRS
mmetsp:Transcript_29832/g.88573  ORF Transcript_29832/g.88573 Transcript_29832/m.88573 type:complete len:220 (-) Transcript_29832:613-1272(-)